MRNGDGEIATGEMGREKQSAGRGGEDQKCKQKKTHGREEEAKGEGRRVISRRGRAGPKPGNWGGWAWKPRPAVCILVKIFR